MKKYGKEIGNYLLILVLSSLIGFGLLFFSFYLPTYRMEKNVEKSLDTLEKEGSYPVLFKGYPTMLDNCTDSLLLNEAIFNNEYSLLDRTLNAYRYQVPNFDFRESLAAHFKQIETTPYQYLRYWHGSLIFLKPLLLFFSYPTIRVLNAILQICLVLVLLFLFIRKKMYKVILPFFLALFLVQPITMMYSLQYSSIYYIVLISMIVMMLFHEKLHKNYRYGIFFLILGILTSYFDLLTYPVASLGMPLCLYFALEPHDWKKNFLSLIKYGLLWAFGYFMMLFSKWFLSALLLHDFSIIADCFGAAFYRTSNSGYGTEVITRWMSIERNLKVFDTFVTKLIIGSALIYYLVFGYINRLQIKKNFLKFYPILLLSFLPIAWYFCTSNHAYVHYWFTYKSCIVLFFGFFLFLSYLSSKNKV